MRKILLLILTFLNSALVHSQYTSADFSYSRVALSTSGIGVIVANTSQTNGGKVLISIVDSVNNFLCQSKIINDGLDGYGQIPDVGIDNKESILIVWEQRLRHNSLVYKAVFSTNSKVIEAPHLVTDSAVSATSPRIAVKPDGKAIIVWIDYRSNKPDLYAQRYFKNGKKIGKNFIITSGYTLLQTPNVAIGPDASLYFVWEDSKEGKFHVYSRSALWDISSFSNIVQIDDSKGEAYNSTPDIVSRIRKKCEIVWKDYREGESNIYIQRLEKNKKRGGNIKINDDSLHLWQRLPCISGANDRFVCVWEDYRNDEYDQTGDIYAQLFTNKAILINKNMKANSGVEPSIQRFPDVAMNSHGDFIISWAESSRNGTQIYFQRFKSIGEKLFNVIRVY